MVKAESTLGYTADTCIRLCRTSLEYAATLPEGSHERYVAHAFAAVFSSLNCIATSLEQLESRD